MSGEVKPLYESVILPLIQDINAVGGGWTTLALNRSAFNALEESARNNDSDARDLVKRLRHAAQQITKPDDYERWNGLFETYQEAVFYLVARARGIALQSIPAGRVSAPDFRTTAEPPCWFEIKTLNISGGVLAQDELVLAGLEANLDAAADARTNGVGFGEQEIAPFGNAAHSLDAIRIVIDKLSGAIKSSQFANEPTYLVACLDRLDSFMEPNALQRTYDDPDLKGSVSGDLWHLAYGKVDDEFHFYDPALGRISSARLEREGLLHAFPKIAGIIVLVRPWKSGGDEHTAFDSSEYKLLGLGREGLKSEATFSSLCDSHVYD